MKVSKAMGILPVFSGSKIGKGDPRYETLIRGFNLRWVGSPRFVQVVGDAEQVRESVQRALWHNICITLRGGGHCYENFVSANRDGVIIDLSGLNRVYEENGMIVAEGGCTRSFLGTYWWRRWKLWRRDQIFLPEPAPSPEEAWLVNVAWDRTGATSTKRHLENWCASTVSSLRSTAALTVSTTACLRSCV